MSGANRTTDGRARMTKVPIWVTVEGVALTDGYISWAQLGDVVTQVWIGGRDDTLSRTLKPGSYVALVAQRDRQ